MRSGQKENFSREGHSYRLSYGSPMACFPVTLPTIKRSAQLAELQNAVAAAELEEKKPKQIQSVKGHYGTFSIYSRNKFNIKALAANVSEIEAIVKGKGDLDKVGSIEAVRPRIGKVY